jgi:hypothetical protein
MCITSILPLVMGCLLLVFGFLMLRFLTATFFHWNDIFILCLIGWLPHFCIATHLFSARASPAGPIAFITWLQIGQHLHLLLLLLGNPNFIEGSSVPSVPFAGAFGVCIAALLAGWIGGGFGKRVLLGQCTHIGVAHIFYIS